MTISKIEAFDLGYAFRLDLINLKYSNAVGEIFDKYEYPQEIRDALKGIRFTLDLELGVLEIMRIITEILDTKVCISCEEDIQKSNGVIYLNAPAFCVARLGPFCRPCTKKIGKVNGWRKSLSEE